MTTLSTVFSKLLQQENISESELARRINMAQPVIHRMLKGQSTNPTLSTLKTIADHFSITVSQLTGETALLDTNQRQSQDPDKKTHRMVPIISWDEIPKEPHTKTKGKCKIFADLPVTKAAFALIAQDSSMTPLFRKGSILIVEPNIPTQDEDYVIAHLAKPNKTVFKQFLSDGMYGYLRSTNPKLKGSNDISLTKQDTIKGVVVQLHTSFR